MVRFELILTTLQRKETKMAIKKLEIGIFVMKVLAIKLFRDKE